MSASTARFTREYDLPVAIVWDALVDEVLVEGWLAVARIDPRVGGEYLLSWQSPSWLEPTVGVITELDERRRLVIETDNIGLLTFELTELPDGTRGTATSLSLEITIDSGVRLLASRQAYWDANLEQLELLLRGHPVDWSTRHHEHNGVRDVHRRAGSPPD